MVLWPNRAHILFELFYNTNLVDNYSELSCFTLPLTQHHSFFGNPPPLELSYGSAKFGEGLLRVAFKSLNPLTFKNDQYLISSYNITPESNKKVTRITEITPN